MYEVLWFGWMSEASDVLLLQGNENNVRLWVYMKN